LDKCSSEFADDGLVMDIEPGSLQNSTAGGSDDENAEEDLSHCPVPQDMMNAEGSPKTDALRKHYKLKKGRSDGEFIAITRAGKFKVRNASEKAGFVSSADAFLTMKNEILNRHQRISSKELLLQREKQKFINSARR
jgi:hypothetical protein